MLKKATATLLNIGITVAALLMAIHVWAGSDTTVYVIAPSVSTNIEARAIRQRNGWKETDDLRIADAILVVIRSSLLYPLNDRYDSVKALAKDADNQLTISGPKFHVYLFQMQKDTSVVQVKHTSYDAQ